jgi:hypothetical protein
MPHWPQSSLSESRHVRVATNPLFARPLKLYALGHGALLLGAGLMHATGSMLPMALGASACLMLTVPLVRRFALATGRQRRL